MSEASGILDFLRARFTWLDERFDRIDRKLDEIVTSLGALKRMTPGGRERATATLRAWLDAHGDVSAAAEVLGVHPQTVRYRLNGVREASGDRALDDPAARLELALALHAAVAFSRFLPGARDPSSTSDASGVPDGPPPGKA